MAYQVVKDTLVELPLSRAALPQLMIPVVQALPVFAELGEAVGVDVLNAVDPVSGHVQSTHCSFFQFDPCPEK